MEQRRADQQAAAKQRQNTEKAWKKWKEVHDSGDRKAEQERLAAARAEEAKTKAWVKQYLSRLLGGDVKTAPIMAAMGPLNGRRARILHDHEARDNNRPAFDLAAMADAATQGEKGRRRDPKRIEENMTRFVGNQQRFNDLAESGSTEPQKKGGSRVQGRMRARQFEQFVNGEGERKGARPVDHVRALDNMTKIHKGDPTWAGADKTINEAQASVAPDTYLWGAANRAEKHKKKGRRRHPPGDEAPPSMRKERLGGKGKAAGKGQQGKGTDESPKPGGKSEKPPAESKKEEGPSEEDRDSGAR